MYLWLSWPVDELDRPKTGLWIGLVIGRPNEDICWTGPDRHRIKLNRSRYGMNRFEPTAIWAELA